VINNYSDRNDIYIYFFLLPVVKNSEFSLNIPTLSNIRWCESN